MATRAIERGKSKSAMSACQRRCVRTLAMSAIAASTRRIEIVSAENFHASDLK